MVPVKEMRSENDRGDGDPSAIGRTEPWLRRTPPGGCLRAANQESPILPFVLELRRARRHVALRKCGSTNLRSACFEQLPKAQVRARPDPAVTSLMAAALSEIYLVTGHLNRLGSYSVPLRQTWYATFRSR